MGCDVVTKLLRQGLTEFLVPFDGDVTEKAFKLYQTGSLVNVALDYAGITGSREGKPVAFAVAMSVSDEKENALEANNNLQARTLYMRNWLLAVTDSVVLGNTRYTLTLSCCDGTSKRNR